TGVPAQLLTESRCGPCEPSRVVPGTTPAGARTLRRDRVGPFAGTGGRCLPHLFGTATCWLGCADRDHRTGAVASGTRAGECDSAGRRPGVGTSDHGDAGAVPRGRRPCQECGVPLVRATVAASEPGAGVRADARTSEIPGPAPGCRGPRGPDRGDGGQYRTVGAVVGTTHRS